MARLPKTAFRASGDLTEYHGMHVLPERVEFELVQLLGKEAPARCLPVDPGDDAFDDPDDVFLRVDRDEVAADPGVAAAVPPRVIL